MPTLKIDGIEITVDRGTTILQAARVAGVDIPTFCYHPGLSIAANCRMCLVETNKAPKPLPACHAQVMDGMEVQTTSPKVQDTQKAVLEFILLNHPVDCPICDQAGECVLQDNYRDHSLEHSRLFTKKVHKPKAKRLGPTVTFDAERCVLCTRCVRFTAEVTKTSELEVIERGEHSEITTFPGKELANPYSLNVVDICPVGALTSSAFRFRRRVWMLQGTRSVCTGCARGCNIRIDHHRNAVERHVANYNPKVNDWWICDEGRLSHARWTQDRVTGGVDRSGGQAAAVGSREAADKAAALLKGAKSPAFLLNPGLPTEDLWVALKLAASVKARLYVGGRAPRGADDALLIRADKNANRRGLEELLAGTGAKAGSAAELLADAKAGRADVIVAVGTDHDLPAGWEVALGGAKVVALADMGGALADRAALVIPAAIPAMQNGTVVNFEGRVQRLRRALRLDPAGSVYPHWRILKRMAATLGAPLAYESEEQIFGELAAKLPAFEGITWNGLGDYGLVLGGGGVSDLDPATVQHQIDRCAPEWRSANVNSRMPWSH